MHTKNIKISEATNRPRRYEDLRAAIASTALIREKDGTVIIGSERTGAQTPWIFDFRALLLQSKWLNRYAEIFWERYAPEFPFQVGGMETAGIALVAAIVMKGEERGTPVNGFYVRKSRKRQGLMKYIEGTLNDLPVVFVDDLINSGQSVSKGVDILAREGKNVTGVFVMLAFRADDAYPLLKEKNIQMSHLFTLADFGMPLLKSKTPEIPDDSFDVAWRYAAPNPSYNLVVQKSAPALDNERIYFGCDDGTFRALHQTTGEVAWEFSAGRHPRGKGILSSPALHDGVVYFGAYDGTLYALAATTGKKLWGYADADWIGSSPDIAPDIGLVFIGLEFGLWRKRGGIAALELSTGKARWTAYHTELTHGSPLYIREESLVVIGSNDGVLYAYDAKTGSLRWRYSSRGDIKTRSAYDAKRRAVIFGSMDGTLYALSAQDGSPLYARETGASIYSTPLVHGDTVYVASLDKCIYALDCASWKDRWIYETRGRIFASPVLADGSLWIGSNDGKLYELDFETGTLKHFFQATERIVNAIARNENFLFVPTVANEVYCLARKNTRRAP